MLVVALGFACKPTPSEPPPPTLPAPTVAPTPDPDAPVVLGGAATLQENATYAGQVSATDADGDLDLQGFTVVTPPEVGSLDFRPDGTFTFQPALDVLAAGESRPLAFSFTASDLAGNISAPGTFTFTVEGENDPPVLLVALESVVVPALVPVDLTIDPAAFVDADALDTLALQPAGLPDWLTWDPLTMRLHGLPTGTDLGDTAVTVTATDAAGAEASGTFTLTVAASASSEAFEYDSAGRLVRAVYGTMEVVYTYDANGNLLAREVN